MILGRWLKAMKSVEIKRGENIFLDCNHSLSARHWVYWGEKDSLDSVLGKIGAAPSKRKRKKLNLFPLLTFDALNSPPLFFQTLPGFAMKKWWYLSSLRQSPFFLSLSKWICRGFQCSVTAGYLLATCLGDTLISAFKDFPLLPVINKTFSLWPLRKSLRNRLWDTFSIQKMKINFALKVILYVEGRNESGVSYFSKNSVLQSGTRAMYFFSPGKVFSVMVSSST